MNNTGIAPRAKDPLLGKVLDERFRLLSLIAGGGMGRVYKAEQLSVGRTIAVKVLAETSDASGQATASSDTSGSFQERFFREAATCARLSHPNIVTILDYGRTEDGLLYIAMELIPGRTVRDVVRSEGSMEPGRAAHIAAQVARALREAHGQGLIHRDIKPANIFVTQRDNDPNFVKVVDFGIVKTAGEQPRDLTETGLVVGTPKYMAPEQIRSQPLDGRCDIYSLGVVLYEMLCGAPPFDGRSNLELVAAHLTEQPPPLAERDPAFARIANLSMVVERCIQKEPDARFANIDELLRSLSIAAQVDKLGLDTSSSGSLRISGVHNVSSALGGTSSGSWTSNSSIRSNSGMPHPESAPRRGRSGLVIGLLAGTAFAAAGGGFFWMQQQQRTPTAPPAVQLAAAPPHAAPPTSRAEPATAAAQPQAQPRPEPDETAAAVPEPAPEPYKAASKKTSRKRAAPRKAERATAVSSQAVLSQHARRTATRKHDSNASDRAALSSSSGGRDTSDSAKNLSTAAVVAAPPKQEAKNAESSKSGLRTQESSASKKSLARETRSQPSMGSSSAPEVPAVSLGNYARLPAAEVRAAAVVQLLQHESTLERRCGDEIRVGVVGNRYRSSSTADARATTRILSAATRNKRIRQRPVTVEFLPIGGLEDIRIALRDRQFDVLYLGTDLGALVRAINRLAGSTRTLVVSDEPSYFLSNTTVVFVSEGKKIKLLVNMRSAQRQRVSFASSFLAKADVYR